MGVECGNCQQQLQLLQQLQSVLRICIVSLVSMDKGAMQHEDHPLVTQAGVLPSLVTAGLRNKTDIQWNVPGGGQANYKDDWHNSSQDCEHLSRDRKEGSKRVTWDELVHVRTIEPCHGQGQWHQPRHEPGYLARDDSFHNSVTSQVFDL